MTGTRQWTMVAAALFAVACGDGPTAPVTGGASAVRLGAIPEQLMEGDSTTATAQVLDAAGQPVAGAALTWASSDEAVVVVTPAGVVRGVGPGTAWVRVQHQLRRDSAIVMVVPLPVASVQLDADTARVDEGATRQLVATLRGPAGQLLTGRAVTWSSSEPAIVQVDALGAITAIRPGVARVRSLAHGKADTVLVVVSLENDYDLVYDAWPSTPGVPSELYRVDMRHPGGMPARVLPGQGAMDVAPSPDGTRIAFAARADDHWQLFVANSDGTGVTRLTTSATDDDQPAWNREGTKIAFHRWDLTPNTGQADIIVINADGSGEVNLTASHGKTNQTDPAWSPVQPDGHAYIVYSSQTNDVRGEAHLWRMRDDGTEKVQLTTGEVWDDQPALSPDGTTIAFQRHGLGTLGDLFLMNTTGGAVRALAGAGLAFGQFGPAWSPDGKLIAFVSKHEGEGIYQVYTVWADGSKLARRTWDDTNKQRPGWIVRN